MSKSDRQKLAAELIQEAKTLGLAAELNGQWVKFTPPPPSDFVMRAVKCGDELAALVKSG